MKVFATYIWTDGYRPTRGLRSKTRVVDVDLETVNIADFPDWGFDGSSTQQAVGNDSDCILKPVNFICDPLSEDGFIVLCEVCNRDGSSHETNTRAMLKNILDNGGDEQELYLGYEKEYVLYEGNRVLGWPETGNPAPQGPYYCGVGAGKVEGRDIVESHAQACLDANLLFYGYNAEVMLGQWEYQIGYRGFDENIDTLMIVDHMIFAEWLLLRIAEDYNVRVCFDNKPVKGDWNGSGCHVNFSTKLMRNSDYGSVEISRVLDVLEASHHRFIPLYGEKLSERLTGRHETCSINEFRANASDRGASIRIPMETSKKGYGYLEDRRPGANVDPYVVAALILGSICGVNETYFDSYFRLYSTCELLVDN